MGISSLLRQLFKLAVVALDQDAWVDALSQQPQLIAEHTITPSDGTVLYSKQRGQQAVRHVVKTMAGRLLSDASSSVALQWGLVLCMHGGDSEFAQECREIVLVEVGSVGLLQLLDRA